MTLHRITTRAFLDALGGPVTGPRTSKRGDRRHLPQIVKKASTTRLVIALLRLRGAAPTPVEIIEDYVYGWDENGGSGSNSAQAMIQRYSRAHPEAPIRCIYGRGYFLDQPALKPLARKLYSPRPARMEKAA
jgi:hypothetical protein